MLILTVGTAVSCSKAENSVREILQAKADEKPVADAGKITHKAEEALEFCVENKMNTDFCILVDMSLHSGVKRFFVWDFHQKRRRKLYKTQNLV